MDTLNFYPLVKPFQYEERLKLTMNPFTVKNVAGALGVVLDRKMIPPASRNIDWALYSPWVEDPRNLWACYKELLSLHPVDGTANVNAYQVPDCMWAGNIAGFVYLAGLTWDDADKKMKVLRYMIKCFADPEVWTDPEFEEPVRLFVKLLDNMNQTVLRAIQSYTPKETYISYCRSFRQGTRMKEDSSMENENYRKILFVDIVAHVLEIVKQQDPGLRKMLIKAKELNDKMIAINNEIILKMLRLQLKIATGDPSGLEFTVLANNLNGLLNRMDNLLTV